LRLKYSTYLFPERQAVNEASYLFLLQVAGEGIPFEVIRTVQCPLGKEPGLQMKNAGGRDWGALSSHTNAWQMYHIWNTALTTLLSRWFIHVCLGVCVCA
jgi:hypothetical protein